MNVLLDTHALIWYLEGNSNLSSNAIDIIENLENNISISIASLWEMAIKIKLNKLSLNIQLIDLQSLLKEKNIEILAIEFDDVLINSTLESHHNDPFDRIIISQSINSNLSLISYDKNFIYYDVNIIN